MMIISSAGVQLKNNIGVPAGRIIRIKIVATGRARILSTHYDNFVKLFTP